MKFQDDKKTTINNNVLKNCIGIEKDSYYVVLKFEDYTDINLHYSYPFDIVDLKCNEDLCRMTKIIENGEAMYE